MPKTIAILGATGNQGSGVVASLLLKNQNPQSQTPQFKIHALTRDPNSASAKHLKAKHPDEALKLVTADVYDAASLDKAFKGVDGLFVVTNNRIPGRLIETEKEMKHELVAGWNIVDAAKTNQIPHVVLSSLPNISHASNGRFTKVYHFDHKSQIEKWAKEELPAVSVLHPGYFYSNMLWPQYCRRETDGTVRFCAPVPGDTKAGWVDPAHDIGIYAAEIFTLGPSSTQKTYPVTCPVTPFSSMAATFTKITGQPAIFDPISLDEWGKTVAAAAGKGYEEDIRQMMEWTVVMPREKVDYGTMEAGEDKSGELGVRASSFEEWMGRSGWRGP